ncbi:MAG TPA: M28 family metallopeptidase [Pyrinomonadaceae bacterium]|nr:M28 family metallopeptidase [Pyrinomonadaceae bacterium]
MKLATFKLHGPAQEEMLRLFSLVGASHILFGDIVLLHAPASVWGLVVDLAQRFDLTLKEHPESIIEENLFLVLQVGSSFQRQNPHVPVLLNRGRHLAVLLPPGEAQEIIGRRDHGYKLFPLFGTQVVVESLVPPLLPGTPRPLIQNLVNSISTSNLTKTVAHLAAFHTRFSFSSLYKDAAQWSEGVLRGLGYKTRFMQVKVSQGSTGNVIADKAGTKSGSRDLILITAHLDSINHVGPTERAPGADDNGSGVAGVLEMARLLAQYNHEQDLRFVLFGGEENGLHGSSQYVEKDPDLRRTRAVINMDMIGKRNYRPLPYAVLIETPYSLLAQRLAQAAATYAPQLTVEGSNEYADSDHVPFIVEQIPAALTIEASGEQGDPFIHTANDVQSNLDMKLMLKILQMNLAFVAESIGIAQPPIPIRTLAQKGVADMNQEERQADTSDGGQNGTAEDQSLKNQDARFLRTKDHLPPITVIDGSFIVTASTALAATAASGDPDRPHKHRTNHPLMRVMVITGDGTVLYRDLQAQGCQIDIWLRPPSASPQPQVRMKGGPVEDPNELGKLEIDADGELAKAPVSNPSHPTRPHVYGHPANNYNIFVHRIRITKDSQTLFECSVPASGHPQGYEIWIWDQPFGGHEHSRSKADGKE